MQTPGDVVWLTVDQESRPDFSAFFADEREGLLKLLYFVTGNQPDAADLAQDAFLKLWERWDRIDRITDPRAYLFRAALNGFRTRGRIARRAAHALVGFPRSFDPFDEVNLREDVREMLLELTPRQRAALVLLDMYGYGSEQAGRILGVRPSTVRALAAKGRAVLRTSGRPDA